MSPAFMDAIADRGVQLIGVDTRVLMRPTPSLVATTAGVHGLWILEQLRLAEISPDCGI